MVLTTLYEQVCRLHPDGCRMDLFFYEAKPGDDATARLIDETIALCTAEGLRPTAGGTVGSYVLLRTEISVLRFASAVWEQSRGQTNKLAEQGSKELISSHLPGFKFLAGRIELI